MTCIVDSSYMIEFDFSYAFMLLFACLLWIHVSLYIMYTCDFLHMPFDTHFMYSVSYFSDNPWPAYLDPRAGNIGNSCCWSEYAAEAWRTHHCLFSFQTFFVQLSRFLSSSWASTSFILCNSLVNRTFVCFSDVYSCNIGSHIVIMMYLDCHVGMHNTTMLLYSDSWLYWYA